MSIRLENHDGGIYLFVDDKDTTTKYIYTEDVINDIKAESERDKEYDEGTE